MSKRLILGVLVAVVASAITAGAVVVVGQQGGGQEPPEETYIPPGTPVASLTLPVEYGPFRIMPPGSVPVPLSIPSPPPGVEQADMDVRESDTLDEFRDHDLFFDPPYIPAGWGLLGAHAETVIWDDGSDTDTMFGVAYHQPEYFDIDIKRFLIAPDSKVQRVGHAPGSGHAYTLGEIRGVPALFQHQAPLQVYFVSDGVLTFIEGVAIDFDELIEIADALIAQGQQGSGQEPPEETYIPPIKAVEEWTPKTPPGTPAAALTLPIDYGRFHIVAPETFPGPYAPFPTPLPGVKKAGHDVNESATLDEFRGHDLFIEPPYIPAGWELTWAHAEAVIWDDGSRWGTMFGLEYQRPQYFYIRIQRFLVAADGRVRLVANPAAEVLYTLGEIRGVPVVYHRDLLQIHFVQGNVLTQIEAPVFDLDELIKIADAMIAETEEASAS